MITAQGERIPRAPDLPRPLAGSRLHAGVFVALAVIVGCAWWLRTPAGLRVDLVGANPALAAQAGLRPQRLRVSVLLASAAFAGWPEASSCSVSAIASPPGSLVASATAACSWRCWDVRGRWPPCRRGRLRRRCSPAKRWSEPVPAASLVNVVQAVLVVGVALATPSNPRPATT